MAFLSHLLPNEFTDILQPSFNPIVQFAHGLQVCFNLAGNPPLLFQRLSHLLVELVLHVGMVMRLETQNRAARPIRYHHRLVLVESTVAARTMLVTGMLLLVFIVIHVLQFTTGTIQVTPIEPEQVYTNLYNAFTVWFIALFYVIAMGLLGLHLYHGVWSLFQTLGLDNPDRNRGLRLFAALATVVVVLGFCSAPVLFYFGLLPEPPEAAP